MRADATTPDGAPRVTVVVAVYNAVRDLARCLDSVLAQTDAGVELVVIDGASTDGSVEVIRARAGRLAYWESSPDRGIYHAWNKALAHARGDWLYFLGADDYLWAPDVLARVAPTLDEAVASHTRVVYGRVAVLDESGRRLGVRGAPWAEVAGEFTRQLSLPHQGVFHHRSLLAGGFDESYRISGDYEVLLRELPARAPRFVDVIVAGWTLGGVSSRPEQARRLLAENHRALAAHGLGPGRLGRAWDHARLRLRLALGSALGAGSVATASRLYRRALGRRAPAEG